jgi:hypothetical protein
MTQQQHDMNEARRTKPPADKELAARGAAEKPHDAVSGSLSLERAGVLPLHLHHLLPRLAARDVLVPPGHMLLGGEELPASLGGADDVVGVGQVGEVGEGELIARQVRVLGQDIVVDAEHGLDLLLVLLDFALVGVHALQVGRERELEDELGAGPVEALGFGSEPLFYRRTLQRPHAVERLVAVLGEMGAEVTADLP